MLESINRIAPNLDGRGLKVGIVMSRFSENICIGLRDACLRELAVLGVAAADVQLASVPGALEIPLVLQSMAKSGRFDALVAIGAVIRGETYHFELVANESGSGVSRVALDCAIPIANAVLTTEDDDQALVRMEEKGRDAARVAVEMARLQQALR
jgi:6,7-dimethyl-8-ribityllumazine synthase